MYNLLLTILLVLSVLLIISIFMQPQKNPSSNVFDSSGSEALLNVVKLEDLKLLCNVLQVF